MARNFEVLISGMAYDQKNLSIDVGDTVTWINDDAVKHSVTTDPGSALSIEQELDLDPNVYSTRQTFSTPGKFSYHCKYHHHMTGSVSVS